MGKRFGTRLLCAALLLAAVATTVASAAPDSAALIARLARRAARQHRVRRGAILVAARRAARRAAARSTYEGAGALHRRVETPYRESTAIRGETVRVERDGEPARTFALRRAPELRGFLTGMLGLLTGDSSLIDEHFSVVASGDDERWRLDLEPVDDRLRQRLSNIIVAGARGRAALLRDRRHRGRHERDVARSRGGAAAAAADRARRAARPLRGMKRSAAAFLVLLAWAAGLAALGLLVERRLDVGSDLRLFLPAPATPEQRLLLDAIGEGPASRLLVVTLEGAPARGARRDVERAGRSAARRRAVPLRREWRRRARLAARGPAAVSLLAVGRRRDARARSRQPARRAPSSRTRPRVAGRLRRRAVDRARSDVAHADAARNAGNRRASRAASSTSGSTRPASARCSSPRRARRRSIRPASEPRSPRSTQRSRPRTPRPARR